MKILSFVIPSYNCEIFLDKCLASFCDATVLDKIEILVINDGSTDNTESVAMEYSKRYPQSFRVIYQENKGHGGAINTGCAEAAGKYIKVIDADDWVETDNLHLFVEKLQNCESDIVLTHHNTINISNGEVKKWMSYPSEFDRIYTMGEIMASWNDFSRSFTFHGITYRTEFYRSAAHVLTEKVFYEDHEFSTFPACLASSVVPLDIFIYDYRIGDKNQSVSDENRVSRHEHMRIVLENFAKQLNNLGNIDLSSRAFVCQKAKILLMSYLTTSLLVDKDRKSGRHNAKTMMMYFKKELPEVYKLALTQYRIFVLFNRLHISQSTLNKLLNSNIYHKIKRTHNFD